VTEAEMDSPDEDKRDSATKPHEKINFLFCRECSNMLYPREDRESQTLMYACRTCPFSEPAVSSCVFRNNLTTNVVETAGVTQDVGTDPTLPRSDRECAACHEKEAVFFQSQERSADTGMRLFYVCCHCGAISQ